MTNQDTPAAGREDDAPDIVARLRAYRVLADRGGITSEVPDPLMIEAADEIERLTRSGAGEVTEAMINAFGQAYYEQEWETFKFGLGDVTVSESIKSGLRAALAAAPSRVGAMETPQQLLQKAEALLHDVDGEHAGWAHALLHQAAAHLSDSEEIRSRAAQETPRMLDALREGAGGVTAGMRKRGIYIASKTKHAERWRRIRDVYGYPVISTWIDEAGPDESSDLSDLWRRCIAEASSAAALIVYRERGEVLKGAFAEMGAALASGTPVFAVGLEGEFSIAHSPGVTHCLTMQLATTAAKSIAFRAEAGEPSRDDGWEPIEFTYRNYRGDVGLRRVRPLGLRFGSTEWHPERQLLLRAFDLDKVAEREFAVLDMSPPSEPVR